jgi:hypothetical protein
MQTSDAVITVHHDSGVTSFMRGNYYKLPVPLCRNHLLRLTVIKSCEKPCEYLASRSTRSLHNIYVYRFQKKGNTTIYAETRINRLSCQDMVFILTLSTSNSSQVSSLGNTRFLETSNVNLTTLHPFHAQFGGNIVREHKRLIHLPSREIFGVERHAQVQRPLQAANQPTPHRESSQSACVSPREA